MAANRRSAAQSLLIAAITTVVMSAPRPVEATPAQPTSSPRGAPAPTPAPPASAPQAAPENGPKRIVTLEDVGYTLRSGAWLHSLAVSKHDPDVAYLGSYDGFVFKTEDGGQTWSESRLIVAPAFFFGDGDERLFFGVHRLAKSAALRSALNINIGIGLPGGAPRLQKTVRRFGKTTSGINLKQTLLLRGERPTHIEMVVIHPRYPKVVYACTEFGLYRTDDGGHNWMRVFIGINSKGREANHIAVSPRDPRRVLLATSNGLYVSSDGGNNFTKSGAQGVGGTGVNWIHFSPDRPGYVFAATSFGLLRSRDDGRTWAWVYLTTFPSARVVRYIAIDPFARARAYIATHDGIFATEDIYRGGTESWRRVGGLRFTSHEVKKLEVCQRHRGHLWALTRLKMAKVDEPGLHDAGGAYLWESRDGGRNWRVINSGNTKGWITWFESDPRDPDLLWIVWTRSISRMRWRPARAPRVSARQARRATRVLATTPPVGDVIQAAQRYTGTEIGQRLRYRRLARLRAWVPKLEVELDVGRARELRAGVDALYPTLPFRRRSWQRGLRTEFRVMLSWDLAPLVFQLSASLFGRISRLNDDVRSNLTSMIHRAYSELKRLRVKMLLDPPRELRVRVMYRLRIEELTAYINMLSGGYLRRYQRGDQPRGLDTPWFEPWATQSQKTAPARARR